jgi:hypothetical protein
MNDPINAPQLFVVTREEAQDCFCYSKTLPRYRDGGVEALRLTLEYFLNKRYLGNNGKQRIPGLHL